MINDATNVWVTEGAIVYADEIKLGLLPNDDFDIDPVYLNIFNVKFFIRGNAYIAI